MLKSTWFLYIFKIRLLKKIKYGQIRKQENYR